MTAPERIQVIEKSLRIFVCGLLGVIPLIGLIPAVYAAFTGVRVSTRYRRDWNPAAQYLNWGMAIALASVVLWFFVATLFAINFLG